MGKINCANRKSCACYGSDGCNTCCCNFDSNFKILEYCTKEHVYEAMAAQCLGDLHNSCWVADAQEDNIRRKCQLVDIPCSSVTADDWRKAICAVNKK